MQFTLSTLLALASALPAMTEARNIPHLPKDNHGAGVNIARDAAAAGSTNSTEIFTNQPGLAYLARLNGNVNGRVEAYSDPSGWGTIFHLNIDWLDPSKGPFSYHIHQNPVDDTGNCMSTGGHLDPYNRGSKPACDSTLPQTCELGDLSGKWGTLTHASNKKDFVDVYLSTVPGNTAFFGDRSFVVHDKDSNRIACGNFHRTHMPGFGEDHKWNVIPRPASVPKKVSKPVAKPPASKNSGKNTEAKKPTPGAAAKTPITKKPITKKPISKRPVPKRPVFKKPFTQKNFKNVSKKSNAIQMPTNIAHAMPNMAKPMPPLASGDAPITAIAGEQAAPEHQGEGAYQYHGVNQKGVQEFADSDLS